VVVYFGLSWRTLRKHRQYDIKDEVEALEADDYDVPINQDPYMRSMSISMSTLASSRDNLVQNKVGGARERGEEKLWYHWSLV